MARALDRVKAAEAKYEAMAATAEKLEATLKELKSTAKSCQWSIDELRRVADREREDENTDFWMFVLMAGIMGVVGGLLGNFGDVLRFLSKKNDVWFPKLKPVSVMGTEKENHTSWERYYRVSDCSSSSRNDWYLGR